MSDEQIEQLRQHDREATDLTIDQQVEIGNLRQQLERLRAALIAWMRFADQYQDAVPLGHALLWHSALDLTQQVLDRDAWEN